MRIAKIVAATIFAAAVGQASEEWSITVCTEGGPFNVARMGAQATVARIFEDIGVAVVWRDHFRGCPPGSIQITFAENAPSGVKQSILGDARPYEGVHIRLFYGRIAQCPNEQLRTALLAHVMAHEITHVLQGICAHSSQGMMKARWTQQDFHDMLQRPLPFTEEDLARIYLGLKVRAEKTARERETRAAL